jgi:hypothetical protein
MDLIVRESGLNIKGKRLRLHSLDIVNFKVREGWTTDFADGVLWPGKATWNPCH